MPDMSDNKPSQPSTPNLIAPRPAPQHGDRAADLIYDTQADRRRGGIWIYPACYDDFYLVRRRAYSLSQGWGINFTVGLFGAAGGPGEVTPSVAVSEPGYYAYTVEDPRPRVLYLPVIRESRKPQPSEQSGDVEEGGER